MKQLLFFCLFLFILIFPPLLSSTEYLTYQIKKGETLWSLSRRYSISLENLCKINNILDVTGLKVGTKIKIPARGNLKLENSAPDSGSEYKIYELKKGETIWRVSKKYGISVETLCKLNNIDDYTRVTSGTKIKIPTSFSYEYLDYNLPLQGDVKLFSTSHFRGIYIFPDIGKNNMDVLAVDSGKISHVENIPGYGLTVFIKHKNGYVSTYAGFEVVYVEKNSVVKEGQIIGRAGNISRFDKDGILFAIQDGAWGFKFDMAKKKFIKKPI